MSFRRVVLLTSIDAGALKGDLGDRVLLVDLETIPEEVRRYKSEIEIEYKAAQPRIFGSPALTCSPTCWWKRLR